MAKAAEGDKAPDFSLPSSEGGTLGLKDLAGKKAVIFFYPKDDTPGCTVEACAFRDLSGDFAKAGARVIGISKDGLASHGKFIEKFKLNFPLLADEETKVIQAFDVWREKNMYGKKTMGVERSTFLLDAKGVIAKAWRKVKVEGHVDEVLKAVKDLK